VRTDTDRNARAPIARWLCSTSRIEIRETRKRSEMFKEAAEALLNPERRSKTGQYDRFGHAGLDRGGDGFDPRLVQIAATVSVTSSGSGIFRVRPSRGGAIANNACFDLRFTTWKHRVLKKPRSAHGPRSGAKTSDLYRMHGSARKEVPVRQHAPPAKGQGQVAFSTGGILRHCSYM